MKSKIDTMGRTWKYCDSECAWINGENIIGCGINNVSKWQIWQGLNKGYYEYKTLKEAMESCK